MITVETVFILGAGASVPYGFPTGVQLRDRIYSETNQNHQLFHLLQGCNQHEKLIEQFRNEFRDSGINSIDAFIAFRPQYQEIGELAIAGSLLPMEAKANLTGESGNWYQMLWNEMLAGIGVANPKGLLSNKVRFITFNYDRSLEQYLLNGIMFTFDLDQNAAFEILRQISIKHVYGSLGDFQPEKGFRYGENDPLSLLEMLKIAQQSIKTVPTLRVQLDSDAALWLAQAQQVFVMGFGFDAMNCDRIGLKDACSQAPKEENPRNIFASSYNLTHAEKTWCESNARNPGQGGLAWTNGDCIALLRDRRDRIN